MSHIQQSAMSIMFFYHVTPFALQILHSKRQNEQVPAKKRPFLTVYTR